MDWHNARLAGLERARVGRQLHYVESIAFFNVAAAQLSDFT
jgi:hypothetical protein